MKFRSDNFTLNKVPNNNEVMRIANIMLNKVPNSNDATSIRYYVSLSVMGVQQFSMAAI